MRFSLFFQSKSLVMLPCLCGLVLSGCAIGDRWTDPADGRERREAAIQQQQRRETATQPPTEAVRKDLLMPARTSINNRIHSYTQKVSEWEAIERKSDQMALPQEKLNRINECKSQLQHILLEYTSLQKQLQQEASVDAAQLLAGNSLLILNQQDIEYLESGCGKFQSELLATPEPAAAVPADPRIKAAFDNSDYDQVINLYVQNVLGANQVPAPETAYQYGQSLLKNHQEAEARKILTEALARARKQPGQEELLLELLQVNGDLEFLSGSPEGARKNYEELVRISIDKGAHKEEWAGLQLAALQAGGTSPAEMKDFNVLLKNYLAYVPKRDSYAVADQAEKFQRLYPASRLAANANMLQKASREQADAYLNAGIKRIEAQASERRAQEVPSPGGPAIMGTIPSAGVGPGAVVQGTQPPQTFDEKALQEEFDRGMTHLQTKEYDKAIERFNRLLKTPLESKARPRIEEAATLGAQEDRQKAADLFIRATNTREPENKKKLLVSSRDLLQGILAKYPQSGLTDKVQRNLARIEAELRTLDSGPGAVSGPGGDAGTSTGGAYVPPRPGAASPVPQARSL